MSKFTVRINNALYYGDMHKIQYSIFGGAEFKNRKKKASRSNHLPTIHKIKLLDEINKHELTLFVRDEDLYTVGFRGKDKQLGYIFGNYADLADTTKGSSIQPVSCIKHVSSSYTGASGLQLFSESNKLKQHPLGNILGAIKRLSEYNGEGFTNLKIDIGILIFVVSEALRFVNVRERINQVVCHGVCSPEYLHVPATIARHENGNMMLDNEGNPKFGGGGGGSFYFKEFENDYKNWKTKSVSNDHNDQYDIHIPHNRLTK